jgi:hypothetical protein
MRLTEEHLGTDGRALFEIRRRHRGCRRDGGSTIGFQKALLEW